MFKLVAWPKNERMDDIQVNKDELVSDLTQLYIPIMSQDGLL